VRDIEVDLNSHVYAATDEGLWRWDGSDWTVLAGLPTDDIRALAIDNATSLGVIYAGTGENGVFVSQDGGSTWIPFNEGLGTLSITELVISTSQPKMLHAGTGYGGVYSAAEMTDCSWLDESPVSGSVEPGSSADVLVTIDTTGLGSNYSAEIVISSNDLDEPVLTVPVTLEVTTAATLTTHDATDITTISATLNGSLDSLGEYATVDVSFVWGPNSETDPAVYPDETSPETVISTGPFSSGIDGLSADTTYYFRAKGTCNGFTVYGDEISFATSSACPGDADGDGVINVLDMSKVARIVLQMDPETPGADANQDGVVNVLDMTKIARIILLLDPHPCP